MNLIATGSQKVVGSNPFNSPRLAKPPQTGSLRPQAPPTLGGRPRSCSAVNFDLRVVELVEAIDDDLAQGNWH